MKRSSLSVLVTLLVGGLLIIPACFNPCEWMDASTFDVRGVEWVGNKVGVLGLFTRKEVCSRGGSPGNPGWIAGRRTYYSRDVMFFVDPSTIHQDSQSGWWIVEADSVWVIHQEPRIGGGDLWNDPLGRGWWLGGKLYDHEFNQVLDSLPCNYHTYPVGDTLYYECFTGSTGTQDTLKMRDLNTGKDSALFTFPWIELFAVSPSHQVYFIDGTRDIWEYRLLRWEGGDSFTVVDSPVISFGFKNDTLVVADAPGFVKWVNLTPVDTLVPHGTLCGGGIWKWHGDETVGGCCICVPDQGGMLCGIIPCERLGDGSVP